jgi:eukaryotic-like serine/threonine-protein kinase
MKRCTTCGWQRDTVEIRCPHDGTLLVGGQASTGGRPSAATWSARVPALAGPRAAPDDELHPGDCVGEYVVERKIGVGGMGVVYGARHPVIGKRAAIKILNTKLSADEESLSRFVLEAQAVNKIGHANIVDIFSFGTLDDGRSYFAMEWLQGETLGQRLRHGPLSSREAIVILSALCRALEAAHAAGVIHRDLKPDNVFLAHDDEGWRVKLLDFGIAKLSTTTDSISRTATGVAVGTPLYMAPEQARGEPVDGRTDVYALGLLAYTALCGESLFQDEGSAIEILAAHISKPPPSPRLRAPDISAAFEQLILDMIAKEGDRRPPVIEVRQRLAAIAATLASPPPSSTGPVTVRAGFVALPRSRPPEMPSVLPSVPPELPPELPSVLPPVLPAIRPTLPTRPQMLALSPEAPALPPEMPRGDDPEADEITVPRRSRWPMAVIAIGMLAASVTLVVAVRRQGATLPPASPPPRLAATPPQAPATPALATPAPVAAAEVTPRAPVPAIAEVTPPERATATTAITPPAPATTELVVEPGLARLAVDGHPVPLVDGRARLTLSPGDHLATATLGVRSTRRRFTVTAEHPAKLSLQVPVADQRLVPPASPTSPTPDDVDSVQDPFHR